MERDLPGGSDYGRDDARDLESENQPAAEMMYCLLNHVPNRLG